MVSPVLEGHVGDGKSAKREDEGVDEAHVPVREVKPRPRHEDLVRVETLGELLKHRRPGTMS